MRGQPDGPTLDAVNREAYSAELCAARNDVETVYVGEEADRLINGDRPANNKKSSGDTVGVTARGQYHIYEAGGTDISEKKLRQLAHTMTQLGKEKVLSMTYVMHEEINSQGLSVKDGYLMENGQRKLIFGKPIHVILTTQGK